MRYPSIGVVKKAGGSHSTFPSVTRKFNGFPRKQHFSTPNYQKQPITASQFELYIQEESLVMISVVETLGCPLTSFKQ